jgi:hypothetical protein
MRVDDAHGGHRANGDRAIPRTDLPDERGLLHYDFSDRETEGSG